MANFPTPESLPDFLAWKPPYVQQLISHRLLVPQGKIEIFGPYKSWKSMTAIDLAFSLSTGTPWLGMNTHMSTVLVVQLEIPKFAYQDRIRKYALGNHSNPSTNLYLQTIRNLKLDKGWGKELMYQWITMSQAQVIIIDPLYKVISGRLTDEWDMRQFTDSMDEVIDKTGVSVVIIHHEGKEMVIEGEKYDRGADASFGSAVLGWWIDSSIQLRAEFEGSNNINVRFPLLRLSEDDIKPMKVNINRNNLVFTKMEQEETNDIYIQLPNMPTLPINPNV